MWHQINYSCGHGGRVYLSGPPEIVNSTRSHLEGIPCYECRMNRIMGGALPRLVGTPADIQLATQIRFERLMGLTREQLAHTEARWWIEHQAELPSTVVQGYP